MKRFFINLISYFKLIRLFNNAKFHLEWYQILEKIIQMIKDTHEKQQPLMTKICITDCSEKEPSSLDLVSLWACTGENNPADRSQHLKAQNEELKKIIFRIKDSEIIQDKNLISDIDMALKYFN